MKGHEEHKFPDPYTGETVAWTFTCVVIYTKAIYECITGLSI